MSEYEAMCMLGLDELARTCRKRRGRCCAGTAGKRTSARTRKER